MSDEIEIAVILTCFNRVKKTLECLRQVYAQAENSNFRISVFLVDDGSSDGTGAAVEREFPTANVIYGDGSLYWNRGMHRAYEDALKERVDYYLWLNDDTFLYDNCIAELVSAHESLKTRGEALSIVIPSTRDPSTDRLSYGGYVRMPSINKISMRMLGKVDALEPCDTFCGNCVLVPAEVAKIVGNMNYSYQHRWGDVDYGLRALEHGIKTWVIPGFLADCESNPLADRWRDASLGLRERLREINSLKGLGKNDWFQYTKRHAGVLWPLVWISPYIKIILSSITKRSIDER